MKHPHNNHIIEQVPVDYYQEGTRKNVLQKVWHTRKLKTVLNLIQFYPKKILDVGCASGWFLSNVSDEYPGATCFGIDVYEKGIQYGKKIYPSLNFKVAKAEKIPFKANEFDLVICTEVLEHVDDPKVVLNEIKRVLKKNGQAVIELDSGSFLFSATWLLWTRVQGKVWNDAHLHSFNVKKLENVIQACGFTVVSKKTFNLGMAMAFLISK